MDVLLSRQEPFHIATLCGSLDATTAAELDDALAETVQQPDCLHMILVMEGVDYVSSAGLRSVLSLAKILRQRRGRLHFVGLCPAVKEVFDISGFFAYFKEFPTVEAALAAGV